MVVRWLHELGERMGICRPSLLEAPSPHPWPGTGLTGVEPLICSGGAMRIKLTKISPSASNSKSEPSMLGEAGW